MISHGKSSPLDMWRGDFGNDYTERNAATDDNIGSRADMWQRVLRPLSSTLPESCLEVGAHLGINLIALRTLHEIEMWALEPNARARRALVDNGVVPAGRALDGSAENIDLPDKSVDLVFTSGVLIHVEPARLDAAYQEMHRVAHRYILTIEYFAHEPETKTYRDHEGLLFKRDWGALWLDLYPGLTLVDYGFFWRRVTGLDNLTWWLFAK